MTAWEQLYASLEGLEATRWLRTGDDDVARRVRALLLENGIDPQSSALFRFHEEDIDAEGHVAVYYGQFVTMDGRQFDFEINRNRPAPDPGTWETATLEYLRELGPMRWPRTRKQRRGPTR